MVYNLPAFPRGERKRVGQIFVLPNHQGLGIGTKLMEGIYSVAEECKATNVTVRFCFDNVLILCAASADILSSWGHWMGCAYISVLLLYLGGQKLEDPSKSMLSLRDKLDISRIAKCSWARRMAAEVYAYWLLDHSCIQIIKYYPEYCTLLHA